MYNVKTIYTFKEVLDFLDNNPNEPWDMENSFHDEYYTTYGSAPLWTSATPAAAKPHIDDLYDLLFARFFDWYCVEVDDNLTATEIKSQFLDKMINILVNTYDKYAAILDSFATAKAKLMGQVESSTETGYNDTPQSEGDYTDSTHRTSYTKVTSLVDGATPVERLDEIQKKIRNTMLEWTDEFKPLFWTE